MTDQEYPNLGFNPVPGMPDAVESLHGKVASTVDSMGEANSLMGRLRNANDSVWQGDAGDTFRQHFNSQLADELDHAHQSLTKAVGVIAGWHTDLLNFKDTAGKLEREAEAAHQAQQQAEATLQQAKANPDFKLAGQVFQDQATLQQAQAKLDTAESAVRSAAGKAEGAADSLQDVIRRAKELESQHEDVAKKAAEALKDATAHLAPHKPGMFSRMCHAFTSALKSVGDWVKDHLKDIHAVLSTISAIAGLVALVTPPPVDAIALGVSVAAGAGALVTDLADPQFRHGMGQLLTGHVNKESLGALMTGVGDVASVIPGAGVGFKALKGTETAVEGASGAASISELAKLAAHQPGLLVKGLAKGVGGKIGEAATFADKLLSNGVADIKAVDRLNLLWHVKGIGSSIKKDIGQATS
ncbi:MAG: integral rane protein [Amycolatopsis sp.]|nr:integral rane protein [Amycolatopsis sp.]